MFEEKGSGIMRFEKLKTYDEIRRSLTHILRAQNTPNADPNRIDLNENLIPSFGKSISDFMTRIKERIGRMEKPPRKNAVLAVEFVITASPEAMRKLNRKQRRKYFIEALRWLAVKVGTENIITTFIHRDESTEHAHIICLPIPIRENSLNCRSLFGGHKTRASELQSEFYEKVSKRFGLGRGVKGSRAKHQSLAEYNKIVNESLPDLRDERDKLKAECIQLEQNIAKGHKVLAMLVSDIRRAVNEHARAVKYTLNELKDKLRKRWGMEYDGQNELKKRADEFLDEVEEKPRLSPCKRRKPK